jgi:hypothetical protein
MYQAEMSRARSEGQQIGQQQGQHALILRQLNRRVGTIAIDLQEKIKALPLEKLDLLGEDLLDFSGLEDLLGWLNGGN